MIEPKQTLKEKWMGFKFDVKIFIYYIITEPFRLILESWHLIINKSKSIKKTYTWIWIWIGLLIVFLITRDIRLKYVAIALLVFMLGYEWEKGYFRKRWKEKREKELKHLYEKNN